ncbi:hypothetical protein L3i22_079990 [Actinoplanes sp. L3-i22]|nr:hypothetical protein L3i22_079990 [Actinoplanes sp. L3-i22]
MRPPPGVPLSRSRNARVTAANSHPAAERDADRGRRRQSRRTPRADQDDPLPVPTGRVPGPHRRALNFSRAADTTMESRSAPNSRPANRTARRPGPPVQAYYHGGYAVSLRSEGK